LVRAEEDSISWTRSTRPGGQYSIEGEEVEDGKDEEFVLRKDGTAFLAVKIPFKNGRRQTCSGRVHKGANTR
jgi:hypothetical protein